MKRNIQLVANQINMKASEQADQDLEFWLSKTPRERLEAVTHLVNQNLLPNQRMNKTIFAQKIITKPLSIM